jgi:hypothetical protein
MAGIRMHHMRKLLLALLLLLPVSAWAQNSPDGTTITVASGGHLVTAAGTWTFGTAVANGGNVIMLNNQLPAAGGAGVKLEVANGGKMYVLNTYSQWWVLTGAAWAMTSDPGLQNPPPLSSPPTPLPVILGFRVESPPATAFWMTDNADNCTGDNFTTGGSKFGIQSFTPPPGITSFKLTCTNPNGTTSATAVLGTK